MRTLTASLVKSALITDPFKSLVIKTLSAEHMQVPRM